MYFRGTWLGIKSRALVLNVSLVLAINTYARRGAGDCQASQPKVCSVGMMNNAPLKFEELLQALQDAHDLEVRFLKEKLKRASSDNLKGLTSTQ